jgi:acetylornithine deacetylase/succinyl-diaminopimelate desuccinylase-like protein
MRMKYAWKVVLLDATLLAGAVAMAQDESCAADREFLKGLLSIPSVTADKAKTDEAVAFVRARSPRQQGQRRDGRAGALRRRPPRVRRRRWPKNNPGFVRMMAMTDATHYAAFGIPVAIIGSMGGNAHANGEWDDLKSIDENAASLKEFLLGADSADLLKD